MLAMRVQRLLLLALALVPGMPDCAVAQAGTAAPVAWRPAAPQQGSLVVLEVHPPDGAAVTAVRGELAGEPLHFERGGGWAAFLALGAVPVTAGDSVALRVVIERATGSSDTLTPWLPVAPRRAAREELRAPPELVEAPDSLTPRLQAEQQLVQAVKRRAHDTPRLWRAPFARPRDGAVTSGFGVERLLNGRVQSRHLGVDFSGRRGAPVRAANRGVVAFAADLYYGGTAVFLDHGAGLVTAYLHLSRVAVAVGDTVARGQVIGAVGASGRVTGPHLHWLATYGDVSVDPLDLLTLEFPDPPATPP